MTQTNLPQTPRPRKGPPQTARDLRAAGSAGDRGAGTRNLKLLITTLSLTTTLSGWALLALNQANSFDGATASDQDPAMQQPTAVATAMATALPSPTDSPAAPVVIIPPLSSLPVRGLREVGEPVQQGAAPQIVFAAPPPSSDGPAVRGGGGGGGSGAPAPAPQPKPQPKPQPVGKGHGSHP